MSVFKFVFKSSVCVFFITVATLKTAICYEDRVFKDSRGYVNFVVNDLFDKSKNKNLSKEAKIAAFTKIIEDEYDLKYAVKFVLSKHWKTLSTDQKKTFYDVYKKYLINSYSVNIARFTKNDTKITIDSKPIINGIYEQVNITIEYKDEKGLLQTPTFGIVVKLDEETKKYKINDLIFGNLSILQSQRDEFSSVMQSPSDGFDSLIKKLTSSTNNSKTN